MLSHTHTVPTDNMMRKNAKSHQYCICMYAHQIRRQTKYTRLCFGFRSFGKTLFPSSLQQPSTSIHKTSESTTTHFCHIWEKFKRFFVITALFSGRIFTHFIVYSHCSKWCWFKHVVYVSHPTHTHVHTCICCTNNVWILRQKNIRSVKNIEQFWFFRFDNIHKEKWLTPQQFQLQNILHVHKRIHSRTHMPTTWNNNLEKCSFEYTRVLVVFFFISAGNAFISQNENYCRVTLCTTQKQNNSTNKIFIACVRFWWKKFESHLDGASFLRWINFNEENISTNALLKRN